MVNERAKEILAYIERFARERGYPPTIREIGKAFRISSTNGVRYYLHALEKAGHVKRTSRSSRGLSSTARQGAPPEIPILGRIAAGEPIVAEESFEGSLAPGDLFGDTAGLFALRVRGQSMIEAGILEGDYVIVRKRDHAAAGEIVVALIEGEATVKYFRPQRDHVELVPANPAYEPIRVGPDANLCILGVVIGVLRTLGGAAHPARAGTRGR